jgi:hypothetical protein
MATEPGKYDSRYGLIEMTTDDLWVWSNIQVQLWWCWNHRPLRRRRPLGWTHSSCDRTFRRARIDRRSVFVRIL